MIDLETDAKITRAIEVKPLADYQKMYFLLCSAASKAIDAPPEEARRLLQNALLEAEDIFVHTCEEGKEAVMFRLTPK